MRLLKARSRCGAALLVGTLRRVRPQEQAGGSGQKHVFTGGTRSLDITRAGTAAGHLAKFATRSIVAGFESGGPSAQSSFTVGSREYWQYWSSDN